MNKMNKEKAYIIFRIFVLTFLQVGSFWVIGTSLVLLTNLYVESELPKTSFWVILWLAGCIEICFGWMLGFNKLFVNEVDSEVKQ